MSRILIVGKWAPIEGGVSTATMAAAADLAALGHDVEVLTNADEVEWSYRASTSSEDVEFQARMIERSGISVTRSSPIRGFQHIPFSPCYSSRLFGAGSEILRRSQDWRLIVGWYLEPYGLVAYMLSMAHRIPFAVVTAGSDVERLSTHPNLRFAYSEVLSRASGIVCGSAAMARLVAATGEDLSGKRCRLDGARARLPSWFARATPKFELGTYLDAAAGHLEAAGVHSRTVERIQSMNARENRRLRGVVIGNYGKVGRSKGSFELLEALACLAREGLEFTFLPVLGGNPRLVDEYVDRLAQSPELGGRTLVLPFLPNWRIPGYLKLCTIVPFLENRFGVSIHSPRIPREILASGVCLVISREIAEKHAFAESFVDQRNCILIADPRDTADLAAQLRPVVSDPEFTRDVAVRGRLLSSMIDPVFSSLGSCGEVRSSGVNRSQDLLQFSRGDVHRR